MPFAEFADELEPLLRQKGWWGRQVIVGPDGTAEMVQLGSLSRLRTILDTNLRMSYARGRWERIQRRAERRPWLRYVATLDDRTRPQHRAWHGLVLRADDPFWRSHNPPNGWHCRCTVVQLSDRDLERRGWSPSERPPSPTRPWLNKRTGEVIQVPRGIDPGFQHNAGTVDLGADAANRLVAEIDAAPPAMARAAVGTPWRSDRFRRFVAGRGPAASRTGDWPVAVAGQAVLAAIAARSRTVRLSDGTATKQREHHRDVAPTDYDRLQRILDEGEVYMSRHHPRAVEAFIVMDGRPWRAVVKATADGSRTYLESLHKAKRRDFAAARRRLKRIDREEGE